MIASVFLGPSMPRAEARSIIPTAHFHPPAAQGDLIAAVDLDGAEIVGLIDGTFHQNLSVWHSEVCYLLSRGIVVVGGSSMGALRATETDCFGTIGVGRIYEWYRDGYITADDEVALVHGDEDSGFVQLSIPLVNIRASVARAVRSGSLRKSFADSLIAICRSLYYPDRQIPIILDLCRDAGFPIDQLHAMEAVLTSGYVDQKLADARKTLLTLRRMLDEVDCEPRVESFYFERSSVFETLYNLDRQIGDAPGSGVTLESVAQYVALHCVDHDAIRRSALNREVAACFGMLLGVKVSDEDELIERETFLAERGLQSADLLQAWLRANAMSEDDLREYLRQEALCRRLRRWAQDTHSLDRGARATLDELRMRGSFPQWANETEIAMKIISAYGDRGLDPSLAGVEPAQLAEIHASHTGVHVRGNAQMWAEDAGFDGTSGLEEALRRFAISNSVKLRISRLMSALDDAKRLDPRLGAEIERIGRGDGSVS